MKVILDEFGTCLADADIEGYVDNALKNGYDIHVGNVLAINVLRARLVVIPIAERPAVTWIFYGNEVHFDDDVRSHDAWRDRRTDINMECLDTLITAPPAKKK